MNLPRANLSRPRVSEQQSGAEDPFKKRDENEGRAGSVMRHHSAPSLIMAHSDAWTERGHAGQEALIEAAAEKKMGTAQGAHICHVWLLDLGSNQGPTD